MGLLDRDVFLLLEMQEELNVKSPRILTLGRLNNRLSKRCLKKMERRFGTDFSSHEYVDELVKKIFQTNQVDTIDISPYQGCKIVHDLNLPLNGHDGEYDLVIDGGTIEHIFNVGVAFRNVLQLIAPGGAFYFSTMGNNHCGHGFYQLSPEFFYSADVYFGCEDIKVFLSPSLFPGQEIFQLSLVAEVRNISLENNRTVFHSILPYGICAYGKKSETSKELGLWPVQSDYRIQVMSKTYSASKRGNLRLFFSGIKQYFVRSVLNSQRFKIRRVKF